MKFVVLFAVIAAWVSSSEAVTCDNVSTCAPDMSKLQNAENNIKEACATIMDAMNCFREAMADCRKNKDIPEATISSLEQQMNSYEQMLEGKCDGAGAAGSLEKLSVFGALAMSFLAIL